MILRENQTGNEMCEDYEAFLSELNVTDLQIKKIARDMSDAIPFPIPPGIEERPSLIQGIGMFAMHDFPAWRLICPMRLGGKRTPAGRKVNHARDPNAIVIIVDSNLFIVACKNIDANEEVTINYRQGIEANVNSGLH